MNFGVIVEGPDDVAVYRILAKRIDPGIGHVHARDCGGRQKLKNKFPYLISEFSRNPAAYNLRKVVVIRDSDCKDPLPLEQELQDIFARSGLTPNFSVSFYVTKCKLETWLLGDEQAINTVSISRGGGGNVSRVDGDLETIKDTDDLYRRTLSQAGLQDTDEVMKQIISRARLNILSERCPRFRDFMRKITT